MEIEKLYGQRYDASFFLLDLLRDEPPLGVEAITDALQERYQVLFDQQSVRRKLNEYEKEGLVTVRQEGRRFLYTVADDPFRDAPELIAPLLDAVCFFQAAAPFGFVGSTILDHFQKTNNQFRFWHDFLVHTLEDEVLPLTDAIQNQSFITVTVKSTRRSTLLRRITGTPLRIALDEKTEPHILNRLNREERGGTGRHTAPVPAHGFSVF